MTPPNTTSRNRYLNAHVRRWLQISPLGPDFTTSTSSGIFIERWRCNMATMAQ
mgnify:FL=1|jgi:hypothetical protein